MKKFNRRGYYHKKKYYKILGIILGVVGTIIIIQAIPVTFWLIILGILCILLGWTFFRMM
ncbi:hypothetical protein GOQ29_10795 [Clostridium sp. D2Q-14]|uniref:hypothetical protein n=1 Tax=Anaeromonas gelatinilytica TaxID=2683194 RepID=UPI00193C6F14|nr:hypothetical protein [Anaeromonas gelatinilytica]MBS4536102.1 hypothetical protein [Anaeromonas gelatinilytica]